LTFIARGSALECAAIQDVLVVSGGMSRETDYELKSKLVRIVAMSTRMAMKFDGLSKSLSEYNKSGDYDYDYDYEHEHEHEHDEEPEPSDADEGLDRPFLTCIASTPRPR
jgi:hypothetical protein